MNQIVDGKQLAGTFIQAWGVYGAIIIVEFVIICILVRAYVQQIKDYRALQERRHDEMRSVGQQSLEVIRDSASTVKTMAEASEKNTESIERLQQAIERLESKRSGR